MFKNLLIIIIAAAVYLHFYPNEEFNEWLDVQKENADEFIADTFDTKARMSPQKLLSGMENEIKQFTQNETSYFESIIESRSELKDFYNEYCGTTKRNPNLRDKQVDTVCEKINKYKMFD